ncbi:MAG: DUF2149 domain-containing protein [Candidatus Altiarchaeota archaeon]|nr:DUF2149 domain-containing protein [Candidatus Altiarchaeota archaeon]
MERKTIFMRKRSHPGIGEDPMEGVGNLFDVAIVFSVALMLALVTHHDLPELITKDSNVTIVKNPGTPDMEIIVKRGEKLEIKKITNETVGGRGKKLGITYVLENGDVIYVPDG